MYTGSGDGVELQPLRLGPESSDASAARLAAWQRNAHFLEPRLQKRFWVALGVAVVVAAGVVFAATSTKQRHAQSSTPDTAAGSGLQGSVTRGSLPGSAPYLAPSSRCQLDTQTAGPEQQLATPLNYHLVLSLSDPAFYQPGDASGRVAAGFAGSVNMTLHVQQDAPCISLHARSLSFSAISARLVGATWLQPPQPPQQQQQQQQEGDVCLCGPASTCVVAECGRLFKPRPGSDAWIMSLGPYLAPAGSTLLLSFTYTADFGSWPAGLWRSAAFPSPARGGEHAVALATQFETVYARTLLPCLDEPAYKATFVVEVEAPSDLTVLSNSPAASTRWILNNTGSVARTTFQPSPVMSTYLLSIAVGDLKAATAHTRSGQTVRVWTTPDTIAAAATPLQLAVSALDHYQAYTGLLEGRGPETKWDLVAVPGKSGAVENWGLLMMDPERFLFQSGGAWDLFRCANVICHELAHQWFGNLVTAATWPDLLVNEGLATLAEYGCMAAVLPQQVGPLGAAVLMRGLFGGPTGVTPGVHEGPFEKTLSYDASPLAHPLLGAADVDFGVPVYSKAAALMAMVASYAAAAGAQSGNMSGPIAGLMNSQPPSALQVVLREHLRQHAYSTATAQEVLGRTLQLGPPDMAGSALQVITGWGAPGSPLIQLSMTPQGVRLQQRRFCSWGLLDDASLTKLLTAAAASTPGQGLATPAATGSSQSGSATGALLCPTSSDGQDRAVPWTPVYLGLLAAQPVPTNSSNTSAAGSSSSSSLGRHLSCGQWVVLMQDEHTVPLPQGCEATAAGLLQDSSSRSSLGFILEGDGGWAVARSHYPAPQRAALRQWVAGYTRQAAGGVGTRAGNTSAAAGSSSSSGSSSSLDLSTVLAASKILQDQAALALSAFGEVPGAELWEVLQAGLNATLAAGAAAPRGTAGSPASGVGFGTVLYTLLAPLLPAVEVLSDRVASDKACWMRQQERLAAALAPLAAPALDALASTTPPPAPRSSSSTSSSSSSSSSSSYASPDQLLGAMSLNRLLTATALGDAATADKLCARLDQALAASGGAAAAAAAGVVLSHIQPDLQHAVLSVAAAQPTGCQLDLSGAQLFSMLQQWYLDGREPRAATMAAFALAHLPARGFHAPVPWQQVLALLLGLNSSQPAAPSSSAVPQQAPSHAASTPVSGVSPAKHVVELAVLLSRAVAASRRFPQPEIAPEPQAGGTTTPSSSSSSSPGGSSSTPVVSELIRLWPQLVGGSMGEATAWEVLRAVAAREVVAPQQWQGLAAWAVQQVPAAAGSGGQAGEAAQLKQRTRVQALLGAAWSTVAWTQANAAAVCRHG